MAGLYSLRVEAIERHGGIIDMNSLQEFPTLAPGAARSSKAPSQHDDDDDLAGDHCFMNDEAADAESVEFSAGNPRVEHITGVVHLYREIPSTPMPSTASHTPTRAQLQRSSSPAVGPKSSGSMSLQGGSRFQLPEARKPVLCCLAMPSDMSLADFCAWCGAYLPSIPSMRLLRREARKRVVCMVLLRFKDQEQADQFFIDYNMKPFSSLEPEIVCRLVYVREVQILSPGHQAPDSSQAAPSRQQHLEPRLSHASMPASASASPPKVLPSRSSAQALHKADADSSKSPGEQPVAAGLPIRRGASFEDAQSSRAADSMRSASQGGLAPGVSADGEGLPSHLSRGSLAAGPSHAATPLSVSFTSQQGIEGWEKLSTARLGTELPTCPVCLERLDEHISGVVITVCNHQFHSDCLVKWGDTSCPVCRYCTQAHANASRCTICNATHDLWICLICGHVGCGRYKAGHAYHHWKSSDHCYALELETQRVWDYAGDNYVHRLIQSKTDGKLVEVPPPLPSRTRRRHGRHSTSSPHPNSSGQCGAGDHAHSHSHSWSDVDEESEWSEESDAEVKEAMLASKLDHIAEEYNHLLTSQLDSQRAYYEGLISQQTAGLTHHVAKAEATIAAQKAELEALSASVKESDRKRQGLEKKLADMTAAHARVCEERGFLQSLNDNLLANQKDLRQQAESSKAQLAEKDKQIQDLQEQVRDLMVFIEAGRLIDSSSDLKDATLLPTPASQASGSKDRKSAGRRGR